MACTPDSVRGRRSLARLIQEGDEEVKIGLLQWINRRKLESEVVLGLGIIDAFDLGAHFEFDAVFEAVRAPSFLADWILKRNFPAARGLSPFRYAASRPQHRICTASRKMVRPVP